MFSICKPFDAPLSWMKQDCRRHPCQVAIFQGSQAHRLILKRIGIFLRRTFVERDRQILLKAKYLRHFPTRSKAFQRGNFCPPNLRTARSLTGCRVICKWLRRLVYVLVSCDRKKFHQIVWFAHHYLTR